MPETIDDLIDAATEALQHLEVARLEELQLRAANLRSLLTGAAGFEETQARQRVFAGVLRATEENLSFLHRAHSLEVDPWVR